MVVDHWDEDLSGIPVLGATSCGTNNILNDSSNHPRPSPLQTGPVLP